MAGTAGSVLAVPLFGRLMISRRGLYSRGGVAPTWWCSIDVNVVTVVLCTALSLTSAFHVIRDITEQKKSTPKARYGKSNPADS